ncbi:rare lipoprotein A [Alkalibacillus filiformis]|uniref:Rare lipoprotein A n=1 Tax=Alkalibacillus filiformis TaxID=200990 RepID=A0ABU0DUD1_9BACI|nr:DUF3889 domain-containing protein [Alkalibacillus filiformis]MDQ0352073.1 rare lipoprotein A [Alkalibacillus filiformis]
MNPYYFYTNDFVRDGSCTYVYDPMSNQTFTGRDNNDWVEGQSTWTEGGEVTKCNIPWSDLEYMTTAVSNQAPYECGEILKVKFPETGREILVKVVDTVDGYPPHRLNLHRQAFLALGADLDFGIIDVEIKPSPELEEEMFGRYLLEVLQVAYPRYDVTDYEFIGEEELSDDRRRETYEFIVESGDERVKVRGTVTYNPQTDRVMSFDLEEVEFDHNNG